MFGNYTRGRPLLYLIMPEQMAFSFARSYLFGHFILEKKGDLNVHSCWRHHGK